MALLELAAACGLHPGLDVSAGRRRPCAGRCSGSIRGSSSRGPAGRWPGREHQGRARRSWPGQPGISRPRRSEPPITAVDWDAAARAMDDYARQALRVLVPRPPNAARGRSCPQQAGGRRGPVPDRTGRDARPARTAEGPEPRRVDLGKLALGYLTRRLQSSGLLTSSTQTPDQQLVLVRLRRTADVDKALSQALVVSRRRCPVPRGRRSRPARTRRPGRPTTSRARRSAPGRAAPPRPGGRRSA